MTSLEEWMTFPKDLKTLSEVLKTLLEELMTSLEERMTFPKDLKTAGGR